ncbi:hypothetical protein M5X17_31055 [Paenibacillus alvei]|uniref:hypothetical protein n=1 Tax=Paenibacillus alvei TaxID=44250 RepID=UPI002280EFC2|nr:hypothetical protein [Paenibacillus alvei]MCY9738132.1 hypothetical protein [Paenibacillus alvei]
MNIVVLHAHITTVTKELLEFAAIKMDENYNVLDSINIEIKPEKIDERIRRIANITSNSFKNAAGKFEGVAAIKKWIIDNKDTAIFVAWDRTLHDYLSNYIDEYGDCVSYQLSETFSKKMGLNEVPSIKNCLLLIDTDFIGIRGMAEYDCENLYNIIRFSHLKINDFEFEYLKKKKANNRSKVKANQRKVSPSKRKDIIHGACRSMDVLPSDINWGDIKDNPIVVRYLEENGEQEAIKLQDKLEQLKEKCITKLQKDGCYKWKKLC